MTRKRFDTAPQFNIDEEALVIQQIAGSVSNLLEIKAHNGASLMSINASGEMSASAIATLDSPNLTGTPTAPTAASGTNTTQVATTAFVRNEVSNLISSAPTALDTLDELAAALGDDANFATTVTNSLAAKAPLASPTFTGTVTLPSATSIGTISSTELGYLDGVTGAIQNQLDAKAPLASPTFTGEVFANTGKFAANRASATSGSTSGGIDFRIDGSTYGQIYLNNSTQMRFTATDNLFHGNIRFGSSSTPARIYSTAGDNFNIRTYTNTPNPNFTLGIQDGAGIDTAVPIAWDSSGLQLRGSGNTNNISFIDSNNYLRTYRMGSPASGGSFNILRNPVDDTTAQMLMYTTVGREAIAFQYTYEYGIGFGNNRSGVANGANIQMSQYGNHSWGMCLELRTTSASDRPSLSFSSSNASTTWSVGYVGGLDDTFRISRNHGFRHGGWGTEVFGILTDGRIMCGTALNKGGLFMALSDDLWFGDPQDATITIRNYADNNWGHMRGFFTNYSSIKYKKDVELLGQVDQQSLYSDMKNTNVYRFRYKEDGENFNKLIGPIIEVSPEYFRRHSSDDGLLMNCYVGMLHGAMKEMARRIETLEQSAGL